MKANEFSSLFVKFPPFECCSCASFRNDWLEWSTYLISILSMVILFNLVIERHKANSPMNMWVLWGQQKLKSNLTFWSLLGIWSENILTITMDRHKLFPRTKVYGIIKLFGGSFWEIKFYYEFCYNTFLLLNIFETKKFLSFSLRS